MSPAKCEVHLRFWDKVDWSGDCWMWLSATHRPGGYGVIGHNGRNLFVHRLAYEWAKGPIPEGLEIDHLCRNHACVNPDHLEAVTHQENVLRGLNGRLRTHCTNGHLYEEGNIVQRGEWRQCRTCKNVRMARWRAKQRVSAS